MKFSQEISIFNPHAIEYEIVSLGSRITQTADVIRLETAQTLTNYSTTVDMNSAIALKADEITSAVSISLDALDSRISQTAKSISFTLSAAGDKKASLSMTYTKEDGSVINLAAQTVTIAGVVTFTDLSTSGSTTINGSNITTGTINAAQVNVTNISASNITTGTLTGRTISGGEIIQTVSGARTDGLPGNKSNGEQASIQNGVVKAGELAVKGSITTVSFVPEGGDGRGSYGIYCTGHFSTEGAIWTNGEIGEADIICRGNAFAQNFIQSSDRRLKENIVDLEQAESCRFIYGLKPVSFDLKADPGNTKHGFIAQDVEELVTGEWDVVTESDVVLIDGQKTKALNYTEIIADLVATVQSQNDRLNALERANDER